MSAELQLTASGDDVEFPYRAMSSGAVASIIFAVIGLIGGLFFWPLLGLSGLGLLAGVLSLRKIAKFPEEFDGKQIAKFGIVANLLVVLGGAGMHGYVYLTEVPEGYTRVNFWELQQPGEVDQPTSKAFEIDGQAVFLKGYIHPSSGGGLLKRFILVPDLGTCCFGGQPKSSDMIEITLSGGDTTTASLRKRKLAGTFVLNRAPQKITDFDNVVFYRMQVDIIR